VRGRRLKLAAAAATLFSAMPASAQPAATPGTMIERAGIRLPPTLCALAQERLDSAPDSTYAIYRLSGVSTLRIYVGRAGQTVDGEFVDSEREIRGYFGDVVTLRDLPDPPGVAEGQARLWRGLLDGSRVMTGLWLWHHGGQRIKLRGTVPLGEAERLWPEIECAVRALVTPA
jgi:hypothetical protein